MCGCVRGPGPGVGRGREVSVRIQTRWGVDRERKEDRGIVLDPLVGGSLTEVYRTRP